MNLFTLSENELKLFVDQNPDIMETHRFTSLLRFPDSAYIFGRKKENQPYEGPGKHVIDNILNYARALEVFPQSSGKPIFLIGN